MSTGVNANFPTSPRLLPAVQILRQIQWNDVKHSRKRSGNHVWNLVERHAKGSIKTLISHPSSSSHLHPAREGHVWTGNFVSLWGRTPESFRNISGMQSSDSRFHTCIRFCKSSQNYPKDLRVWMHMTELSWKRQRGENLSGKFMENQKWLVRGVQRKHKQKT